MTSTPAPPLTNPSAGPPELPPQGFLVDFNVVPTKTGKPSINLYAAYRIPGELVRYYGAKVGHAAFIGAVDLKTGAAFVADGSTAHGVPLDMDRLASLPPPCKSDPEILAGEGTFVVDLPRQLGIPAEGGEYAVVVWVDQVVSKVKVVKVPADPERRPVPAATALPAQLSMLEFGKKDKSPKPQSGILQAEGAPEEKPFGIGHVYATVGPNVIPKDAKVPFVTVFASVWQSREVSAQSVIVPGVGSPEGGGVIYTDFEVGTLFHSVTDRRKSFALVLAGTQVSSPVILNPKR
jgi:hypothetical protein